MPLDPPGRAQVRWIHFPIGLLQQITKAEMDIRAEEGSRIRRTHQLVGIG
jgi:hypothetical protein